MTRPSLPLLAVVFLAGAAVALGAFFVFGHDRASAASHPYGYGYGMMGGSGPAGMMGGNYGGTTNGYGAGMMGGGGPGMMRGLGGTTQTSVSPAQLTAVRDRVEKQLASSGYKGFTVGEIMAFTNNDYLLVRDANGAPAFELLADPNGRWLMPEPGPNMMWNTSYGMMRGLAVPGCPNAAAAGAATSPLSAADAKTRANAWLAQNRPEETTADATPLPGYFTIDVVRAGDKVGMLSVNATTGAVWFHSWHGSFLADQDF